MMLSQHCLNLIWFENVCLFSLNKAHTCTNHLYTRKILDESSSVGYFPSSCDVVEYDDNGNDGTDDDDGDEEVERVTCRSICVHDS